MNPGEHFRYSFCFEFRRGWRLTRSIKACSFFPPLLLSSFPSYLSSTFPPFFSLQLPLPGSLPSSFPSSFHSFPFLAHFFSALLIPLLPSHSSSLPPFLPHPILTVPIPASPPFHHFLHPASQVSSVPTLSFPRFLILIPQAVHSVFKCFF